MPEITFSLVLPQWLAQWYVHRTGGQTPVRMPKNSCESLLVQTFAQKKSAAQHPDIAGQGDLELFIPANKAKPPQTYSHISDSLKSLVRKAISDSFDLAITSELVLRRFPGSFKKDVIEQWMRQNGIEITETACLAIEKRYDRRRAAILTADRVRRHRKNK